MLFKQVKNEALNQQKPVLIKSCEHNSSFFVPAFCKASDVQLVARL